MTHGIPAYGVHTAAQVFGHLRKRICQGVSALYLGQTTAAVHQGFGQSGAAHDHAGIVEDATVH